MLPGRVYRIFLRYADIHVAADLPGAALRDGEGGVIGRVDGVSLRRSRLWFTGQADATRIEIRINRTRYATAPVPDTGGDTRPVFATDVPAEIGPIHITADSDAGPATLTLPGLSPVGLRLARLRVGGRFIYDLLALTPQIYRWKWRGDMGAREAVKERLGLVPRADAQPLSAPLLLGGAAPVPATRMATLVLPVYNAFDMLPETLDRINLNSGDRWRLVVVDDASPDDRVRPFLREWCADPARSDRVTLLCNDTNRGFIGSVNRAFETALTWPNDPVVLVNSDAFVPKGWLDRLLAPLDDPSVASVTPLSNDGEIFTVPAICQRCDLPPGVGDTIDAAAARLAPDAATAETPTGVGFCMALAPRFLAQVPRFDPAFGAGYGEENDWCRKTAALGGRHLGLGNLFVEHRGGASFGNAVKQRQLEKNLAEIARRYPGYDGMVQDFIRRDPFATARMALGLAWAGAQGDAPVSVYLAHALGGGAENYLARRIAGDIAGQGAAVVVRVGLPQRWQVELHSRFGASRGTTDETDVLAALIDHLPRRRIVYSCGVGDRDPVGLSDALLRLAGDGTHPIEVLMHDYFPVSPSYTLLGRDGVFRGVPVVDQPLADDPAHGTRAPGGARCDLADWQTAWGRLLAAAERVTVFSRSSRDIVAEVYPAAKPVIRVVPHELERVPPRIPPGSASPPVIGVLGNIGHAKGAALLRRAARDLTRSGAGRIVVIGHLDPDYSLGAPHVVHGEYQLRDLPGLVARYGIGCWLIPSIWPETFSFTTHEALATGMPVFAFDLGAQGEAVARAVAEGAPGGVLALPEGSVVDFTPLLRTAAVTGETS